MAKRNFDSIVVGMDLGGLLAAALLVTRGKSVLVADLSGGRILFDPSGISLSPSPNLVPGMGNGGLLNDVLQELKIPVQRFRNFKEADPAFQVITPNYRLDVPKRAGALLEELSKTFPEDKAPLSKLFGQVDKYQGSIRRTLAEPGLFRAPGLMGRHRTSQAEKRLWQELESQDTQPFQQSIEGLTKEVKTICTGLVSFLTRFQASDMSHLLALYHLGHLNGNLHTAPGGITSLTDLCKEKVASLRGSFCQTESICDLSIQRNPRFRLRFTGIEDDFFTSNLIWNTDPSLLKPLIKKRLFHSLKTGGPSTEKPAQSIDQVKIPIRTEGLPIGMMDDLVLIPAPEKPADGTNLLHITIPPGSRKKKTTTLIVTFRSEAAVDCLPTRRTQILTEIMESLHIPIPFLDHFLEAEKDEHDLGITVNNAYERKIFPANLPLGSGSYAPRSSHTGLFYSGREALPGLGMVGETVVGKACADIISQFY